METVPDVLARGHEREGVAFDAPGRTTAHSFREFCTTAWKAGNLLRQYGVRSGSGVVVIVGQKEPTDGDQAGRIGDAPDPLLAALGATCLGGVVHLRAGDRIAGDALVAPAPWLDRIEAAPGCTRLAYGGPPDDPAVVHFERAAWSENPVEPPEDVSPDDNALEGNERHTHGELVGAASAVIAEYGLTTGDRVAVRAPLSPGAFAAGVLAPLVAGATIVGGTDDAPDAALVVAEDGDLDPATFLG